MNLTLEQARAYLASIGVVIPDFLLEIYLEQTNAIDACLVGAGYPDATAKLIKLYLLTLVSIASSDRQVSSESAPSGASRSYRFGDPKVRWNQTVGLLRALDKSGCATIPESPFPVARAGFWVATGGCDDGCGGL